MYCFFSYKVHSTGSFESARYYLTQAKTTLPARPKRDETIADLEEAIGKAEVKFAKKLEKEQKQKLIKKEEAKQRSDLQ
jgi:predicted GIY-YIG superfamily endonuclease